MQENDTRYYSLKELRAAADEACVAAIGDYDVMRDNMFDEDMGCMEAREWRSDDGARGYEVHVSSAAPDAEGLKLFLRQALAERGFEDIEVLTEW